ncbi:rubrerythrin-like domain-containing protein [Natrialbaceae archaeon A-gly3]
MIEPKYDPTAESDYECHQCGEVVVATSFPGDCPNCGATFRNRAMPME